jgi:hypothetical protein
VFLLAVPPGKARVSREIDMKWVRCAVAGALLSVVMMRTADARVSVAIGMGFTPAPVVAWAPPPAPPPVYYAPPPVYGPPVAYVPPPAYVAPPVVVYRAPAWWGYR